MGDVISKARRSQNMRGIRSVGTAPEMFVLDVLRKMNRRFRTHVSELPGRPDIVFPRSKRVIEVRGCFWHQHKGCIDSHIPRTKVAYWRPKLRGNVQRDIRNLKLLKKLGYRVLIIWECELKQIGLNRLKSRLRKFLARRSI
jgi:DNA mismatch endonuclease, patch repair protein